MDQLALHEWNCPSCGATTRARMADHESAHGIVRHFKNLADYWEQTMPKRPISEISAAVRAVTKVCVEDLRGLISELESTL